MQYSLRMLSGACELGRIATQPAMRMHNLNLNIRSLMLVKYGSKTTPLVHALT